MDTPEATQITDWECETHERIGTAATVEQAADAIVITDADGIIQFVNNAFTTMTGYSSQEAVGQKPRILQSGRHPDAVYQEPWNMIRSGRVSARNPAQK
jgi:PAS domain S-box-containing protein